MPVSDDFLEYVLDLYSSWGGVSARKMFGGAGLYREGRMFALVADDIVYLKVDGSNRPAYEERGCLPFKPYADRQVSMSYYEAPADVLEDSELLIEWSEISLAIQKTKT